MLRIEKVDFPFGFPLAFFDSVQRSDNNNNDELKCLS